MNPSLSTMLTALTTIAKENQTSQVRCHGCRRSVGINRHGSYERYLFRGDQKIKVPRYLCLNPECRCVTFSVLPHPFLRYIRLPLCFLFLLVDVYEAKTKSLSSLAREAGLSRPVIKRSIVLARRLGDFLDHLGLWPNRSRPCLDPPSRWTDFNRALSCAFFPNRYGRQASHTI